MKRRQFMVSSAASVLAASGISTLFPLKGHAAGDLGSRPRLAFPPLLDTTQTGRLALATMSGTSDFLSGVSTATTGFGQTFLGPTILMKNGALSASIQNRLDEKISIHWHGLMIPGDHDGGPHLPISPGGTWSPDMEIAQNPATAWYHSHIHGRTAQQVYKGLAGVIHVTDGKDDQRGLPSNYGFDDLTLVLQDRRFDASGQMVYDPSMMDIMHGFAGNKMLVNGQIGAVAAVPRGIVRLRLLNGSNARIYSLFFNDQRLFHLVATDGGYLPNPMALGGLTLSPGERAEILVDFSEGATPVLMSDPAQAFGVLEFAVDDTLDAQIATLPETLDGAFADLAGTEVLTRQISLDMGMGGMMMGGGFAINGRPFDMERVDFEVKLGSVERWVVRGSMVAHPFHVHGVNFRVLSENGNAPRPENRGRKDTVLVSGETEIIARFDQPASHDKPFMCHCHILEHEDAGMMAQFAVV